MSLKPEMISTGVATAILKWEIKRKTDYHNWYKKYSGHNGTRMSPTGN
jgi:uncharacterized protein (DUF927 family)